MMQQICALLIATIKLHLRTNYMIAWEPLDPYISEAYVPDV